MIDHPAAAAVRKEKGRLHRTVRFSKPAEVMARVETEPPKTKLVHGRMAEAPIVPAFTPAQVNAMLRVEYSREEEEAIYRGITPGNHMLADQLQGRVPGPLMIEGVAWYCVPSLPAPGWRVVNPMDARPA